MADRRFLDAGVWLLVVGAALAIAGVGLWRSPGRFARASKRGSGGRWLNPADVPGWSRDPMRHLKGARVMAGVLLVGGLALTAHGVRLLLGG